MKRTYLTVYMIVTSLVALRALINGQDLVAYIDFTSLSLVLAPSIIIFLLTKEQSHCIKYVMHTSMLGGIFGSLLGTILTFSNGHFEPEGTLLGLSIALLPVFYAILLNLLILPLHIISKEK